MKAAAQITDQGGRIRVGSRQPDIGCRPLGFGEPPWGLIDHRWSKAIARGAVKLLAAILATPTNPRGEPRLT